MEKPQFLEDAGLDCGPGMGVRADLALPRNPWRWMLGRDLGVVCAVTKEVHQNLFHGVNGNYPWGSDLGVCL